MTLYHPIGVASDRVMHALITGLEIEFGRDAGRDLAAHFLAAEACDFHWDARSDERWLGAYDGIDEEDVELDRVAILGRLDGRWFAAILIVDGDGSAHDMLECRTFADGSAARRVFIDAR